MLLNLLPIKFLKLLNEIIIQGIYFKNFFIINLFINIILYYLILEILKNIVNQYEFCKIHYNKLNIISYKIQ